VSFNAVGDALFRTWVVPFEVASLVLLVALVGAIVIAGTEEEEE
jgi:NADH-quinone oxidoreductase subunit J